MQAHTISQLPIKHFTSLFHICDDCHQSISHFNLFSSLLAVGSISHVLFAVKCDEVFPFIIFSIELSLSERSSIC